jgi:hypothetical protein
MREAQIQRRGEVKPLARIKRQKKIRRGIAGTNRRSRARALATRGDP